MNINDKEIKVMKEVFKRVIEQDKYELRNYKLDVNFCTKQLTDYNNKDVKYVAEEINDFKIMIEADNEQIAKLENRIDKYNKVLDMLKSNKIN